MPRIATWWVTALATTIAGAGSTADFDSLEQRLVDAADVRFDFVVTAEGVIEAHLSGNLEITVDRVRLAASGTFAGEAVELSLRSESGLLELGNGTDSMRVRTPAGLEESLLIGLTRMGILHNLARLTELAQPDHADGGVREWVTVRALESEAGGSDAAVFDLIVAGEPAGTATLAIDSLGRPTIRRQTVEFSSGQMRVVERYSAFSMVPE